MKTLIVLTTILLCAHGAFAQPLVNFNNNVPLSALRSPVYGPEPGHPTLELHGNGSVRTIPVGEVVYGGPMLGGTAYTAELWGRGNSSPATGSLPATESDLVFIVRTTFRTGTAQGFINTDFYPGFPGNNTQVAVPFAPLDEGQRGTFQVRAYENRGHTVNTWADVVIDGNILRGASEVFSPEAPLGLTPLPGTADLAPVPNLIGLTSFNIHTVPEPSVWALGVLGAAALLGRRRSR